MPRLLLDVRIRLIVVAGLGAVVAILAFQYQWFASLDLMVYDLGLAVRSAPEGDTDVVLVAIDKQSRQNAFPPPEFPISAHVAEHAELIERLSAAGAAFIAMDILFDQLDPGLDLRPFLAALGSARTVCLAAAVERRTIGIKRDGSAIAEERLVLPSHRIPSDVYCLGLVNMPLDWDRAVRRSSYGEGFQGEWLPSMPVAAAAALSRQGIDIPDDRSPFWIDYRCARSGITTIPYTDILTSEGWEETVRGRAVFVGVTENSLSDIYELPIGGLPATEHGNKLPGVLILAYAAQTLLRDGVITPLGSPYSLILGIALAVVTSLTALGRRLALNVGLVIVFLVGLVACGIMATALRLAILPSGLVLGVTFVTAIAGLFVNYLRTRFKSEIQEKELEEISSDLHKAAKIQQRLQPETMPTIEGIDIAGFQIPCKEIGGDYYDVIELGQDRIGMLIADVCGKGISAALLMSNLQSNFRQLAPNTSSARQLVVNLNAIASQVFGEGRFVTLLYAILDVSSKRFSYCSAGHMPPLVCRRDGELLQLERGGLPVGVFPDFEWEEHEFQLRSGDLVFMYTDGLSEATMPRTEELYGEERIRAYMAANFHKAADQFNRDMAREAQQFSDSPRLDDDITLLTLRIL
jgi:CHASE2 domain-containing sensor protein